MSCEEFHTGKLVKKELKFTSIADGVKQLQELGYDIDYYDEDDWYSDEVFLFGIDFYVMENHCREEEGYIKKGVLHDDGSIDIVCKFYNGGTCLSEEIQEILEEKLGGKKDV
jgi:hypothetical protein